MRGDGQHRHAPNGQGPEAPLLKAEGLERSFGEGATAVRELRGVDLEVEPGELVAIMGPSGSGKSTLLHILGALDRQRVAIARALLRDPRLVLADEPTGNFDSASGAIVMGLLRKVVDGGQTVVMVTHDIFLRAGEVAGGDTDRIIDALREVERGEQLVAVTHERPRRDDAARSAAAQLQRPQCPTGMLIMTAVLGVVIGTLAAILPARRAAHLDPLQALTYE